MVDRPQPRTKRANWLRERVALWLRFKDHIERRLGGAPDAAEAAGGNHLTQFGFAGLCAERGADLLR